MGCRKLSYYKEGEGLENCSVFFGGVLGKKGGQQKNRVNYSPFGLTFNSFTRSYSEPQKYKFGGKEEQEETGLYDFEARMYDPAIARWTTIDPLAEIAPNWTPYRYGFNNPMRFTDPTGMSEVDESGENFTYTDPDEIASVLAGLKKLYGDDGSKSNGGNEQSEEEQQEGKEIAFSQKVDKSEIKETLGKTKSAIKSGMNAIMSGGDSPSMKEHAIDGVINEHVQVVYERRLSLTSSYYVNVYLPDGVSRKDFLELAKIAGGQGAETVSERLITKQIARATVKKWVTRAFAAKGILDPLLSSHATGHNQEQHNAIALRAYSEVLINAKQKK